MKFKKLVLNEDMFGWDLFPIKPTNHEFNGASPDWRDGAYWELYRESTNEGLLEKDCSELVFDYDYGELNKPDYIFSSLGEQALEFIVNKYDIDPDDIDLDDFEIIVYSDEYSDSRKLSDLRDELQYMFESVLTEAGDPYEDYYDRGSYDDPFDDFSLFDDLKFEDMGDWDVSCDLYRISDGRDEYYTTFELYDDYEYKGSRAILRDAASYAEAFLYEQFDFGEWGTNEMYNNYKVIIHAIIDTNDRKSYEWEEEYLLGDLFDKLNGR